jgi:hypothetical protein
MSFKDSFERWKCLAVADRVGERIPGFYSRVREGSVAVPFATESRDAKNSSVSGRAEVSRRYINMNQIRKIDRGSTSNYLVAEATTLIQDPLFNGEPMEFFQQGCGGLISG